MSTTLANPRPVEAQNSDVDIAFEDFDLDDCDVTGLTYPEPDPLPADIFDNAFVSGNYIDTELFDKSILTKGPNRIYADVAGEGPDLYIPCMLDDYFDMDAMEKEMAGFTPSTNVRSIS